MPPTVARLALEMSGANRSLCGAIAAFRSSRTMPGSMRAQRSCAFTSSTRLKYFDVSTTTPAPIAWPACDVPPPRMVIEHPCFRHATTTRLRSSRDFGITTPAG